MPLTFAGVKKSDKTTEPKSKVPLFTVPDTLRPLVDNVVKWDSEMKALKAQSDTAKTDLMTVAKDPYYTEAHRNPELSSLRLQGTKETVLFVVSAKLKGAIDLPAVKKLIGGPKTDMWFHQTTDFSIDFDQIPDEKKQQVANELVAVLEKHGCTEAAKADQKIVPVTAYWTARHALPLPTVRDLDLIVQPTGYIKA